MDKNGSIAKSKPNRSAGALLNLETFLPYRLNVAASLASRAFSRIYTERHGLSIPEWRLLATLGEYGTMTGKVIGAHAQMHKTKVSRAAAALEERKLLERRVNIADMREAFLTLTPAGKAIYEDLAPIAEAFARRMMEAVAPADRAAFDRALAALIEGTKKLI